MYGYVSIFATETISTGHCLIHLSVRATLIGEDQHSFSVRANCVLKEKLSVPSPVEASHIEKWFSESIFFPLKVEVKSQPLPSTRPHYLFD